MKSDVKKIIEKELGKYKQKDIKISDKRYVLYVVPELCNEDLNIFEGFIFLETDNRSEVFELKTRYKPPVSGYAPRIGIILYEDHLLIKDYRNNKHIIKTLKKINGTFLEKLKKALSDPTEANLNKLFDRSDVIEEFYILFKKSREYLLKKIRGISEEENKEEFIDNFMMQMLTLWYLQERGFFNNDKNYFITKFNELKQKKLFGGFDSYYEFLTYLFEKIGDNLNSQYYEDEIVGRVVVIGPAVFLNGEHRKAISVPDECFYKEGMTETLINIPPGKMSTEVPLLNLFESRDWTEGNIDEFVLGSIYEKLITYMERKELGAYYTPEEITSYICKNTIELYLVDRINEKFNENFINVDQIIESNNRDVLLYLYEQLKEIKILDPAVGSAHFLESAINVLVGIYEKIREKAKELNIKKGLEITATDEKGEIRKINLLEISDEERFKLLIKFFIILSRNLYGVDINPTALKVARARLFLTLAKHFSIGKEKDVFIRFPNVHFNLRVGNSLIGYVELVEEKQKRNLQLDLFAKENQVKYIIEKIKVVSALKPYLEKTAESLNINGNIVEEVEELNTILLKKELNWNDFKKVLKTKEKLIAILIASLNTHYAQPLNDLLREITDLFNQKLDEKFAEEHNISLEDLKQIKTFHWLFEFPEVFLRENAGFDVVVGNPPYGKIKNMDLDKKEKQMLSLVYKNLYKKIGTNVDFYKLFLERSLAFVNNGGYFSFLMPVMFWGDKDSFELRNEYFGRQIKKILHFPLETTIDLFKKGINYEVSIFILKNIEVKDFTLMFFPFINKDETKNLEGLKPIELTKGYVEKNSKLLHLPLFKDNEEKDVIDYLSNFRTFGNYVDGSALGYIFVGKLDETNDKKYLSDEPTGDLAVASNHIKDWFVDLMPRKEEKRWIINGLKFRNRKLREPILGAKTIGELMNIAPKLVGREMANRAEKRKLHFSILFGNYILTNSVRVIILNTHYHKTEFYLKLLALFNSTLLNWRFKCYSFTYHIKPYEIEELPIINLEDRNTNVLLPLAKYMLFLEHYQNYFAREDRRLRYIIDYFDNLIDCLVYELYLGDVVKIPVKRFVEDKLEDIDLYDNLLKTEEKEREEILQKIEEVYKKLENDKNLDENLYLIKLDPWIKTIYEALER